VREVAALAAAAGIVMLLVPLPRLPATRRRVAGLALLVVSWVALAASLVPAEDARRELTGAPGVAVGVVVLAAVVVGGAFAVRLILARPTVWFVLLALALPVRLAVSLGSEESSANLLVPLYAVELLGLAAWVWGRLRGRLPADAEAGTPLDVPIGAFVGFVLASTLWSGDTHEAAVKAVFFWIPFVVLYLLVVAWWGRARALAALAITTVAMAVPVAGLAVVQYANRDIFWNQRLEKANVYSQFFRANGIFFDPNILGRYLVLAMLLVVAAAWALRLGPRLMVAAGAALAVLGAGLFVTFSRSSALALMVGLAILAWRAFGGRRTLAVGGTLLVVLLAGAVATSGHIRDAVTSTDRLERVSEGRFDLVAGGLDIWRESPVVGSGLGSFEQRYKETLTPTEQRRVRVIISHNAPVTVLSEVGAVGFLLFLGLLWTTGRRIARRAGGPGPAGWAEWTALAMLAGILVHSLLYAALFEDPYTWVVAAAAIGLARGAPRPPVAPAPTTGTSAPVPVG
jgi:O-antigen ligase